MNILFVSLSAPPKNCAESLQAGKYIKYLSQKAHVSLITTVSQGGWRPDEKELNQYLKDVKEICLVPIPTNKYYLFLERKLFPKRLVSPDPDYAFALKSDFVVDKIKRNEIPMPDVIYSRSMPYSSALMGLRLKEALKKPWIMHLSDPWTENPYSTVVQKNFAYHLALEKKCFEQADKISLTSELTIALYVKKYPQYKDKFFLSPNVYDHTDLNPQELQLEKGQKLRIVFTGRLYGIRNPAVFFQALSYLRESMPDMDQKIEVIIAGFVDQQTQTMIDQAKQSLPVNYLGHVSFQESMDLQRSAHILLVLNGQEDSPIQRVFFISKLLDYMAAKRRVLAISEPESTTSNVVNSGFGESFGFDQVQQIAQQIQLYCEKLSEGDTAYFVPQGKTALYESAYNANILFDHCKALV